MTQQYSSFRNVPINRGEISRDVLIVVLVELVTIFLLREHLNEAGPLPNFVGWFAFVICGYKFKKKYGLNIVRALKHLMIVSIPVTIFQITYIYLLEELSFLLTGLLTLGIYWAGFSLMFTFGYIGSIFAKENVEL